MNEVLMANLTSTTDMKSVAIIILHDFLPPSAMIVAP